MREWDKIGMKQSPEMEAKKSMKQKAEEVLNFYRKAFCVDGDVKLASKKGLKIAVAVELNDTKRGKFYIGVLEDKK